MTLDNSDHAAHRQHPTTPQRSFWKSKAGLVACGFLLVGGVFLLMEHRAHVLGVLPYLLILACPLMHLFMHKGHGGHHGHDGDQPGKRDPETGVDA